MATAGLSSDQAEQLFERGGFVLLSGLPAGSTFGVDGSEWTVKQFSVRHGQYDFADRTGPQIRAAWPASHHCCGRAVRVDAETIATASAIGVRQGVFRFVGPQEVVIRSWSAADERIHAGAADRDASPGPAKRRRIASPSVESADIVSRDHLRSIDTSLAPYPFETLESWKALTALIDERCVARVIGFDERGDALVDAVMAASGDVDVAEGGGRQTWGKARERSVEPTMAEDDEPEERLRFVEFDLRRSWPAGSVGADVSTHSRDKSWLLGHVITTQLQGTDTQLLAELSLAFVTFTLVHNHASLEAYQRMLSLLCRSPAALTERTPLFVQLLRDALPAQLASLAEGFFDDMSELETFYLAELAVLGAAIKVARRRDGGKLDALAAAWARLTTQSTERFGWSLPSVEPDAIETLKRGGVTRYNLLKPDDQSDEDDEDAPVVVMPDEMDEPAGGASSQQIRAADDADEPVAPEPAQPATLSRAEQLRAQLGLDDDADDDQPVRLS